VASLERQRSDWQKAFDSVEQEIFTLFFTRQTWRVLRAVFTAGGTQNRNTPVSYLDRTYVAAVCSAIRRQLDTDSRSNSLVRSLQSIRNQPRLMDRARFVALHDDGRDPDPYFDANVAFNQYADPSKDFVDVGMLDLAISNLKAAAHPVEKFADRVIAHSDRRSAEIAFGEIDHALEALDATVKQFWGLVHPGVMLHTTTPVMDLNFLRMFTEPLIDPGFVPPREP
jgi:hypothetical protein